MRRGLDVHAGPGGPVLDPVGEVAAEREARVDRRDRGVRAAEGAVDHVPAPLLALVEEDDCGGAGGGRVVDLDPEGARTALDQRDAPGDREPVEVRRLTAAARARLGRRREGEVDGDQGRGHVAAARELGRRVVDVLGVGRRIGRDLLEGRRRVLEEEVEVERLAGDLPARVLHRLRDVVRRGGEAGEPGRPRAAVGVGERLQLSQVSQDPAHGQRLAQLRRALERGAPTLGALGAGPSAAAHRNHGDQQGSDGAHGHQSRLHEMSPPSSGYADPPPALQTFAVPLPGSGEAQSRAGSAATRNLTAHIAVDRRVAAYPGGSAGGARQRTPRCLDTKRASGLGSPGYGRPGFGGLRATREGARMVARYAGTGSRRLARRTALLLATLAIGALALAAGADAYVYFGNYGTGSVGRFDQNSPSGGTLDFIPNGSGGATPGWPWTAPTSTGRTSTTSRSGAPRSMPRTSTRTSSPKPACPLRWRSTTGSSTGRTKRPAIDRTRAHQRRSEQRQPELHPRPQHQHRGNRGRRQAHLLDAARERQRHPPRSDAPTSAARPSTRASSRAPAATAPTTGSRSTPSTSTGRTAARHRARCDQPREPRRQWGRVGLHHPRA